MAKLSIIFPLFSLLIVSLLLPLAYSKTKVTNIRLYLHVQDQFNETRPAAYGNVFGFQDLLTDGHNPNSRLLGRAQGTLAFTAYDASFDLHVSLAYIFTSGKYNGSTVVSVGRNDVPQNVREIPIVGGTGAFRLARGIVRATTYSTDPPIYIHDLEIIQDCDIPRILERKYAN
ncbi:hypothetical protein CASFOL_013289 [Castilleja foliolosa]|uniref:Dirigent protein n=1 Tax=Castilleja foliolosa TaxID=1961234 RepID=A0ABD3DNF5_9LAMI